MVHLTTPGAHALRTWVLQATASNPQEAQEALLGTLQSVQADLQPGDVVDVFAPQEGLPPSWRSSPQWRWWPACRDLPDALRHARPDGLADVAWVQAGWRLSKGWRHRLQQSLSKDPAVGLVGPLSLHDEWRSPLPNRMSRMRDALIRQPALLDALADWLAAHAPADLLDLATWPREAGVLRGAAAMRMAETLHHIDPRAGGHGDGYDLLAREASLVAFSRHVLSYAHTALAGASTSVERAGGLLAERAVWQHAHPLSALRSAVEAHGPELMREATSPARASVSQEPGVGGASDSTGLQPRRTVRLHVAHSWGGGLSKWVGDFIRTDQATGTGTGLVLRSVGVFGAFGQRLCLYAGDEEVVPLRYWELGVPVHATATGHLQVRQILREIIEEFGVDQVLVSSLIGHSVDVLRTGLPTVVIAHDHYPFCVTLYAHFEGECRSCSRERLGDCLARNPAHRFFKGAQADEWMSLREAFVRVVKADQIPIVAPTPSVAARWQSMMPGLATSQFRVIEHGLNLPAAPAFEPAQDGRLRVLVLGRLSPEKGVGLLLEMLEPLLSFADLMLVGCGERIDSAFSRAGVVVVPDFDNRELPTTLAALAPHVGLLMSTVPETFSYTLSELRHVGIPVVATANGALADRIEDGVTGYLTDARADALLARLRHLDGDRGALQRMRAHLLSLPTRGLRAMLDDYLALLPVSHAAPGAPSPLAEMAQVAIASTHQETTGANRTGRALHKTLLVNPEVTWLQAARGFWLFTCQKAARSPRLPVAIKRLFARWAQA